VHEAGIAMEVLRLAQETARAQGARRVTALRVLVGRWSGVEPETLRFALETLADGPALSGCRVDIEVEEPRFRCGGCGNVFPGESFLDLCPSCGDGGTELVAGDELVLREIEVEE